MSAIHSFICEAKSFRTQMTSKVQVMIRSVFDSILQGAQITQQMVLQIDWLGSFISSFCDFIFEPYWLKIVKSLGQLCIKCVPEEVSVLD